MIVSLKRWRPLAWPKLAWRGIVARPASERKERESSIGFLESFEKMAENYADTIIRAATK